MAHELLIGKDGEASMFYVDEVPWHGLGRRLENPPTAAKAIKAARLDWKVDKAPLFYHTSISDGFMRMARTPMTDDALTSYLASVFPDPAAPTEEDQARLFEEKLEVVKRGRLVTAEIYRTSPHCTCAGRTLWAAYNAVTERVDHWTPAGSRGRNPAAQLNRIWFGNGYRRKVRAYDEALRRCAN